MAGADPEFKKKNGGGHNIFEKYGGNNRNGVEGICNDMRRGTYAIFGK